MDMRALILRQDGYASDPGAVGDQLADPGAFLELARVPIPKPGPGQVLIKLRRAGVNPSDIAFVQGYYGQPRVAGAPAGFEGVGTVVEAGPGLMGRWLKGRDVAFFATRDGSGSWAEYAVTQASAAIPLRRGVADRDGANMLVNPITAAAMLDMVRPGEAFVFSAAASQLGKLTASLARDQGKRMIAITRRDAPGEALRTLGAAHVLNERSDGFAADLRALCRQERPTIFLDAVAGGASPVIFKQMGKGARWVVYGKLDEAPAEILEPGELIFLSKRVEGFWLPKWLAKVPLWRKLRLIAEVQRRFATGAWVTDVTAEIPLDHALGQMADALTAPDGKVQIVMGSDT